MTDERIKEAYDTWVSDVECTENERQFFSQYPAIDRPTAIGFYAGFRAAERLAKIEVLEETLKVCDECRFTQNVQAKVIEMLSELKEANR